MATKYHYLTSQLDVNMSAATGAPITSYNSSDSPHVPVSPAVCVNTEYVVEFDVADIYPDDMPDTVAYHSVKKVYYCNVLFSEQDGTKIRVYFTPGRKTQGDMSFTIETWGVDGHVWTDQFAFHVVTYVTEVVYSENGGQWSSPYRQSFSIPKGTDITVYASDTVSNGTDYDFMKWNSVAGGYGDDMAPGDTITVPIVTAYTIYAIWQRMYTLRFMIDQTGGSIVSDTSDMRVGEGYTFNTTNAAGGVKYVQVRDTTTHIIRMIQATPDTYYHVVVTPSTGVIHGDATVYISFVHDTVTLSFAKSGSGTISWNETITVPKGTTWEATDNALSISAMGGFIVATPSQYYQAQWTKSGSQDAVITENCTFTAVFTKIPVTSISIDPSSITIARNREIYLRTIVTPSDADPRANWSASSAIVSFYGSTTNQESVKVLTGDNTGTVTITAESIVDSSVKGTCAMEVELNLISYILMYTGWDSFEPRPAGTYPEYPAVYVEETTANSYTFTIIPEVPHQWQGVFDYWYDLDYPNNHYTAGQTITVPNVNAAYPNNKVLIAHFATATYNLKVNYRDPDWSSSPLYWQFNSSASDRSHTFTIDWTPYTTKPGYDFIGWATRSGASIPEYANGDSLTLTLATGQTELVVDLWPVWRARIPTPSGYPTDFLPKASVRIFKSPTAYIDVTYGMSAQPKIHKSVNRAGSFTFTLTNDPDDSYLSPSFDGWADGSTGAVDWGMYCIVEDIRSDGTTQYITDGIISSLTVNEYALTIECADLLAVLGSSGADIHRNYYDQRTANALRAITVGEAADNYIDADVTDIYEAGGTVDVSTVKYRVARTESGYDTGDLRLPLTISHNAYEVTWTGAMQTFSAITFRLWKGVGTARGTVSINGSSYLYTATSGSSGSYDVTIDTGMVNEAGTYTITITGLVIPGSPSATSHITAESGSGGTVTYTDVYGVQRTMNGHIRFEYVAYDDNTVTSSSVITSGSSSILRITAITGATITTDYDMLTDPANARVKLSYLSGTVAATAIMENIALRSGFAMTKDVSAVPDGEPNLKLFRSGGGFSLDYLQKVADIDKALTFTAKGTGPSELRVGARRTSASTPAYDVTYGNSVRTATELIMFDFTPRKTMQNRPSRALIRTAISAKSDTGPKPVIAMVYNDRLLSARGIPTDTVVSNSSVLTVYDAVRAAYAAVNTDEEDWEGVLTLSGIVHDMIDTEGPYAGSGKVLSITDPRYGFSAKSFVITDVTIDYNNITTQVSLSNAPQVYSSAVAESMATAYVAADLVVGDSESTAYNTQYVYMQVTGATVNTQGSNTLVLTTGAASISITADVTIMPGHALLYGAVTISNADASTDKYDGLSVSVNGTSYAIPAEIRPDCYEGQTVIINVDVIM